MPLEWDARKRKVHDDKANVILTQGEEAVRRAKGLIDNFARIGRHIDGIAKIALPKKLPQKPDLRLHAMLARMEHSAQTKSLQGHLSAIVPLLSENAGHAEALAQHWTEMHKQLSGIVALFNS
jgi:hypothetical protein